MNWNSKTKKYTGLVKFKTKLKRSLARFLYFYNWDVKKIAKLFFNFVLNFTSPVYFFVLLFQFIY